MHRIGNLWPRLTSFDNLLHAAHRAAAGKRQRPDVATFLLNLEPAILALRRELLSGVYRPGPYRSFSIIDPKPRTISAAPFRDRVVHHALTQILEPHFEPRFSPHSFACRVGKGTHAALALARLAVARHSHCLKCDIRKYFASIDHQILNSQLARVIKCPPTLALSATIIAGSNPQEEFARYFPGDNLFTPFERRRGLPLGNQTSQFFANVYLNPIDHFIDRHCRPPFYARYVDDWVMFHDSKHFLSETKAALEEQLSALRLLLHDGKSRVHPCSTGVSFLGWRLFPTHARLPRPTVVRTQRRLVHLQTRFQAGLIPWRAVQDSIRAWLAHASWGDTKVLRSHLLRRFSFRAMGGESQNRPRRFVQQQC